MVPPAKGMGGGGWGVTKEFTLVSGFGLAGRKGGASQRRRRTFAADATCADAADLVVLLVGVWMRGKGELL